MRNLSLLFCKVLLIGNFYSYAALFAQQLQPTKNLPILEFKSNGNNDYYVILLTGNGGFRHLAQSVTQYLNAKNVSVLAIKTNKYLEAIIDRYNIKWGQEKVVFIGYSMGAEIFPFAVNCLDGKYRNELNDLILIAPWQKATFKARLADRFFEIEEGDDIYAEIKKLKTKNKYIICDDNKFSICYKDMDGLVDHDLLGGGHHFGKDYEALSKLISKRLHLE